VRDGDIDEVRGYGFDTPVILLEEYMYNRAYSLRLMNYIGHRFNNIGILTDRERFFYD
jgi:hypothetical protein